MKDNSDELSIRCDCGYHYLTVSFLDSWGDECPTAYLTVERESGFSFWYRLKEAIRIILNRESYWTEFILEDFNKLDKLEKMLKTIRKHYKKWEEKIEAGK